MWYNSFVNLKKILFGLSQNHNNFMMDLEDKNGIQRLKRIFGDIGIRKTAC